jgi:DNA-binding NarL/FixJ family response regulator
VSHSTRPKPLVAIFDSADDVIERLARVLEDDGFETVTGRMPDIQSGVLDLVAFLDEHDPQVVLFDLPRPYEQHLNFLRLLATSDWLKHRGWVLMAADAPALEVVLKAAELQPSIIGTPYLPQVVLQAVRTALEGPAIWRDS